MDTVGHLTFLLKALSFHERVPQRGLVARIYHKVRTHHVLLAFPLLMCLRHILTGDLSVDGGRGGIRVMTSFWKQPDSLPATALTASCAGGPSAAVEPFVPIVRIPPASVVWLPWELVNGVIWGPYWDWKVIVSMYNECIVLWGEMCQAYVKINHWISLSCTLFPIKTLETLCKDINLASALIET